MMRQKPYFLNTALAAVVGVAGVIVVLIQTFLPRATVPTLDIPMLVALSLVALVLDPGTMRLKQRPWAAMFLLAAATFGLLSWSVGVSSGVIAALRMAALGGGAFIVTALLFLSMRERIASGPAAKGAVVVNAVLFHLACQCFFGFL